MVQILLMTNDERGLKLAANVTKTDYCFMDEVLSTMGGFLRFHVSLYSDKVIADKDEVYGAYVNRRQAIKWISDNVFNGKMTLDRYNEIKKTTRLLTD